MQSIADYVNNIKNEVLFECPEDAIDYFIDKINSKFNVKNLFIKHTVNDIKDIKMNDVFEFSGINIEDDSFNFELIYEM